MDPPDDQHEFSFPTSHTPPNFGPFSPPSATAASSIFRPPPPSGTGASSSSSDFRLHPPPGFSATSPYPCFRPPPPPGFSATSPYPDFRLHPPPGFSATSPYPCFRLPPPSGAGASRPPRKRGRPRKDATRDQTVPAGGSVAASSSTIRTRTRNRDGGQGFTPHFINVNAGEDVYQRLMQFLVETRSEMFIMSASGLIGSVTLRQPADILRGTFTIQGEFDIVSLCGCYVRDGDRGRIGGFAVNLGGSNGEMIGGRIEGALMAAGPVQVIVGMFECEGERNVGLRMELPSPAAYRGGYSDQGNRVRRRAAR